MAYRSLAVSDLPNVDFPIVVVTTNYPGASPETVESEISRGDLVRVPVRDLHFQRKLRLAYREESTLSHAGRAFLKVAEQVAKDRGGRYRFLREK